jgi:hypothetical protein
MKLAKLGDHAEKLSLENSRILADAAAASESEEVQVEMLEGFARKLLSKENLSNVMFHGKKDASKRVSKIVQCLTNYTRNKTHDRHIHSEECVKMGLEVKSIEDDPSSDMDFQDPIPTVHHCYMNLLMNTPVFKVIENHMGVGMNKAQIVQNPPGKT